MTKIIALNHKMNLNYDLVNEYIERINKVKTDNKIIRVCLECRGRNSCPEYIPSAYISKRLLMK